MISVAKLHYGFLQGANHTDSQYLAKMWAPQRDHYLNRAKTIVLRHISSLDENNETVRNLLSSLVIRDFELSAQDLGDKCIAPLPDNFYRKKVVYLFASKNGCPNPRRFRVRKPTSEKLQSGLRNTNTNRFWDFEETFAVESSDGLVVYKTPELSYDIRLDYIRSVADVAYPKGDVNRQYIGPDGNLVTQQVDLDIDNEDIANMIVSMAILEAKKDYGLPPNEYQTQRDFILQIDKL